MTVRAGVVLVVGLALAGCSGGGSGRPQASNVVLPPVTASPTPSPTAVALPSAATASDAAGAEAFARYYYDTLSEAFSSGETTRLRALSSTACKSCLNFADSIDRSVSEGGRLTGGRITVREAAAPEVSAGTAAVSLVYSSQPLALVGANGKVLQSRPAEPRVAVELTLRRRGASWRVEQIVQVPS